MALLDACLGTGLGLLSVLAPAQSPPQFFQPALTLASATILARPLTARKGEELAAELQPAGTGREVVVDPALPGTWGGRRPLRPASYEVSGRQSAAFAWALPTGMEITLRAPGATMAARDFTLSVDGGPAMAMPGGLIINRQRGNALKVGATLVLAAGQPNRAYLGHYNVTLAYN